MLKDAGYAMEHGYGSSSRRSTLFGIIVSVYAEDGSLLFQRSTSNKASPAARSVYDPKTQAPKSPVSSYTSSGKDPFK